MAREQTPTGAVTPAAIAAHIRSVADWVDPETTVDRIIIGDPERPVSRALVTWISSFRAVRAAVERGCELLVTHEPTFWVHRDELPTVAQWEATTPEAKTASDKLRFIEDNGLVILRVHDAWDRMPEIGIPWAWAGFLGLGKSPAATAVGGCYHRYDLPPIALDALARRIAEKTAAIGEPAVQVVGEPDRVVSKLGIGTGCYCDPRVFHRMGCDVSLVCDDGNWYWERIQWAADADHAVIRVNHGTSEEPGMVTLAEYLRQTFPSLTVEHLLHGSCFRLVPPG